MPRDRFHLREAAIFVLVVAVLSSCVPLLGAADATKEAKDYKDELRRCRVENATCLGYVACRQRVASEHGETYTGRCLP